MKRVAIVLAFVALFAFPAKAYDFALRMSYGDTLFFEVTDAQRFYVSVVAPSAEGPNYYDGHKRPSGVIAVPAEVTFEGQRYTVTAIGERAFSGCSTIRMITLPKTITEIGPYAFYGCAGINEPVIIGENVKSIGASAFYGCLQIPEVVFKARKCEFMGGSMGSSVFGNCVKLKKVKFDKGVTRIPDFAFSGVDAITSPLVFPPSLEYVGDYAFAFCNKISGDVTIPDQVERIGEYAFNQCHAIVSLSIGKSVTSIGERAFNQCIALRSVKVNSTAPPTIEMNTFSNLSTLATCSVPCVSKALYEGDAYWKKLAPFVVHGNCHISLKAEAAVPEEARVLGGGNYKYGDSVELVVVCAAGYGFVGWTDGNRENPRTVVVQDDMSFKALTHAAKTLTRIDTLYLTDTVYEEGYKVIHDTVDIFEAVRPLPNEGTVVYNAAKNRIEWKVPEEVKMLSLMVFDAHGDCLYKTERQEGKLRMGRFATGTFIVRVETVRRVERYRFFVNNE